MIRAPLDETGPARQGCEVKAKIVLPELRKDTEQGQTFEQSVLRLRRQASQFPSTICNFAGGPFSFGEKLPGTVKPLLPVRHGPGCMAFVQKSFAPLDRFAIDLLGDLSAKIAIAPRCQRDTPTESRFFLYAFSSGWRRQRRSEMVCKGFDSSPVRMATDLGIEHLVRRCGRPFEKMSAKRFQLGNFARSQFNALVFRKRFQSSVEMTLQNPARAIIVAKKLIRQITFATKQLLSSPCGLVEMDIFQAMKRIVMNKGSHRPVMSDDLARKPDQPSQLHPLGFAVRHRSYLIHDVIISVVAR